MEVPKSAAGSHPAPQEDDCLHPLHRLHTNIGHCWSVLCGVLPHSADDRNLRAIADVDMAGLRKCLLEIRNYLDSWRDPFANEAPVNIRDYVATSYHKLIGEIADAACQFLDLADRGVDTDDENSLLDYCDFGVDYEFDGTFDPRDAANTVRFLLGHGDALLTSREFDDGHYRLDVEMELAARRTASHGFLRLLQAQTLSDGASGSTRSAGDQASSLSSDLQRKRLARQFKEFAERVRRIRADDANSGTAQVLAHAAWGAKLCRLAVQAEIQPLASDTKITWDGNWPDLAPIDADGGDDEDMETRWAARWYHIALCLCLDYPNELPVNPLVFRLNSSFVPRSDDAPIQSVSQCEPEDWFVRAGHFAIVAEWIAERCEGDIVVAKKDSSPPAHRQPDANTREVKYAPGALAGELGVCTKTVNNYAKKARVKTAKPYEKSFRWSCEETIRICEKFATEYGSEKGSSRVRQSAKTLIDSLTKTEK